MDEGQRGWSWMGVLVACCAALCSAPYSHALNADQCNFFAIGGKTQICHATNSPTNPYVHIDVSRDACVNDHSQHASDYIAVNDPACDGSGCLPLNAPVDSLGVPECCEGLTAVNGFCNPACQGGTFIVTISGPGFLDETTWRLAGASTAVVAVGGPYQFQSTNTTTHTITTDLPLTFDIETQGVFNDNVANYTITCASTVVANGSLLGGQTTTVPNICCSAPSAGTQ